MGSLPDSTDLFARAAGGRRTSSATQSAEALRDAEEPPSDTYRPLVSATLVIEATDARWLEHLAPGMLWDSYAYDSQAAEIP